MGTFSIKKFNKSKVVSTSELAGTSNKIGVYYTVSGPKYCPDYNIVYVSFTATNHLEEINRLIDGVTEVRRLPAAPAAKPFFA